MRKKSLLAEEQAQADAPDACEKDRLSRSADLNRNDLPR